MKIIFFIVVLLIEGCSTRKSSACGFNLALDGWGAVKKNSNDKIKPLNDLGGAKWYKNSNGDYLICHALMSDKECGGAYELFSKRPDGSFEYSDILCME